MFFQVMKFDDLKEYETESAVKVILPRNRRSTNSFLYFHCGYTQIVNDFSLSAAGCWQV